MATFIIDPGAELGCYCFIEPLFPLFELCPCHCMGDWGENDSYSQEIVTAGLIRLLGSDLPPLPILMIYCQFLPSDRVDKPKLQVFDSPFAVWFNSLPWAVTPDLSTLHRIRNLWQISCSLILNSGLYSILWFLIIDSGADQTLYLSIYYWFLASIGVAFHSIWGSQTLPQY